jgi:AraC family transcriptional regulator
MPENEPGFLSRQGCDTAGTTPAAAPSEARREPPAGQVVQRETSGRSSLLTPLEYHRLVRDRPAAASLQLGWVGLDAARYGEVPDGEVERPPLTHHTLAIFTRPDEMDFRYEEVKRHLPPPGGSVTVVPAGIPSRWRWRGFKGSFNVYLEPGLVERVAAEAFDLDPARLTVPPLDGLELPHLRAAMTAVGAELASGGPGGPLAAESLANLLAVHLIRHVSAPRRLERGRDGVLPRGRLRAVEEYIEEHLDGCPTLAQLAAVVRLNPYHFARQFKAATGLPPHQYVILRRVERAKQLLQAGTDLSLAEVALRAGFSDQSQFSRHFKRLVGVTPGQFRTPSRIA